MIQYNFQIGETIKRLRKSKELTQIQLAAKAGVDNTLICKIEKGNTGGSLDTLQKLAAALGVSVTDLLDKPQSKASGE